MLFLTTSNLFFCAFVFYRKLTGILLSVFAVVFLTFVFHDQQIHTFLPATTVATLRLKPTYDRTQRSDSTISTHNNIVNVSLYRRPTTLKASSTSRACHQKASSELHLAPYDLSLTALASPWRSGNTWVRHLLQQATGKTSEDSHSLQRSPFKLNSNLETLRTGSQCQNRLSLNKPLR